MLNDDFPTLCSECLVVLTIDNAAVSFDNVNLCDDCTLDFFTPTE